MNPNTKKITPVFTPFIEGKWGDYSVKDMSVSLTKLGVKNENNDRGKNNRTILDR